MRVDSALFIILLVMCSCIGAMFFIQERPYIETIEDGVITVESFGHGVPHPQFKTMLHAGDGGPRFKPIWPLATVFGLSQVALFVVLLALGGRKQEKLGPLKVPLLVGGIFFAGAFLAMVLTYRSYVDATEHALFLGFPIPTAWMMYGVWLVPLVFMLVYLFTFDSWFYTDEDRKRFEQLLAQQGPERPES